MRSVSGPLRSIYITNNPDTPYIGIYHMVTLTLFNHPNLYPVLQYTLEVQRLYLAPPYEVIQKTMFLVSLGLSRTSMHQQFHLGNSFLRSSSIHTAHFYGHFCFLVPQNPANPTATEPIAGRKRPGSAPDDSGFAGADWRVPGGRAESASVKRKALISERVRCSFAQVVERNPMGHG